MRALGAVLRCAELVNTCVKQAARRQNFLLFTMRVLKKHSVKCSLGYHQSFPCAPGLQAGVLGLAQQRHAHLAVSAAADPPPHQPGHTLKPIVAQVIEFESTALMIGQLGVRVSLIAYPVVSIKKARQSCILITSSSVITFNDL